MIGKFDDEIERIVNEFKMICVLMFVLGFIFSYSLQSLNLVLGEFYLEYVLISEIFLEVSLVGQKMVDKVKKGKLWF